MNNPFRDSSGLRLRLLPTVSVYLDKAGEWRWQIKAANHEIIGASTEGYNSKQGALQNLKLIADLMINIHNKESKNP